MKHKNGKKDVNSKVSWKRAKCEEKGERKPSFVFEIETRLNWK